MKYNVSVYFVVIVFCLLFICLSFALFCFIPEMLAGIWQGSVNTCGLDQLMDDICVNVYDVHEPGMAKYIYKERKTQLKLEVKGKNRYI